MHLRRLAFPIACLMIVAVAACGGAKANDPGGVLIQPASDSGAPTPGAAQPPAGSAATNGHAAVATLTGFAWPLAGACLPRGDQLMPNAARPYRNGVHEGVDFYAVDNCTPIARGTPVLAAKAGTVIRADLEYRDLTSADVAKYQANPNSEEALDTFRGRQVWIDHGVDANGNRIVTRYCHLSAITPGIVKGMQVSPGQPIASVGNSGTPESVTAPGSEMHLHFEIRVGESYLGKALPPLQVRGLYVAAFGP